MKFQIILKEMENRKLNRKPLCQKHETEDRLKVGIYADNDGPIGGRRGFLRFKSRLSRFRVITSMIPEFCNFFLRISIFAVP